MSNPSLISLEDIQTAHSLISPHLHRTPLLTNSTIDSKISQIFFPSQGSKNKISIAFKAEHLQKIGAFKARGATNAVQRHFERARERLGEDFDPSKLIFLTHSSGNHAGAIAFAAAKSCRAVVVMPSNAPKTKRSAVEGYGARVVECEPTLAAREETAAKVTNELESQGLTVQFVHPYDEPLVIAGQGTLAIEMMEQAGSIWAQGERKACSAARKDSSLSSREDLEDEPPFDIIIAPIGGGGMMSGVSTAVKGLDGRVVVVGAEPEKADDAYRSLMSGELQPPLPPTSICDGLLTALSPLTFSHIKKNVSFISLVSEESVIKAMKLIWERMKQIVEPSACVGLASLLQPKDEMRELMDRIVQEKREKMKIQDGEVRVKIGIVWSGGNVELSKVLKMLESVE